MHSQVPISKSPNQKLFDEHKEAPFLGVPYDVMVQKFNLDRKYHVIIPDKKDWKAGTLIRANSKWYTDGSKTHHGVGAEIYAKKPKKAKLQQKHTHIIAFIKRAKLESVF